ncbi:MAG TPA: tetratricopeptide repeat protein [Micromonosporaceae bacterium]|nr:tetratricopeptide repeat protein [Micromonosporaceae bacterium]
MSADRRIPPYLGRLLAPDGEPVGTCFQVAPGVLVTAWHVLDDLGAGSRDSVVTVDSLDGGLPPAEAQVVRVDPLHDLAVLRRSEPLGACIAGLAATDTVPVLTPVMVTGVTRVPDPAYQFGWLDAPGAWQGGTTRDGQVPLGRLAASGVMPGMSGAPVRRLADDVVVGVVSARYNSADGWGRDSVWVARTEHLEHLLHGLAEVEITGQPPLEGAVDLVLSVSESTVRLRGGGHDVSAAHRGVGPGLANVLHDLRRQRARAGITRADGADLHERTGTSVRRAGELLAESFLPEPVAAALGEVLRRAERAFVPVRIGVDAPGFSGLPWEALPEPVTWQPLALHPLVTVYRVAAAGVPPVTGGPLRIVVAISAPVRGGGAVLDYERELRKVLAAVRGARQGQAQVQVVPFATTAAIRAALDGGGVHVLHISAHGGPGVLVLEDEAGNARSVTADELVDEAVPAGAMPPVVALAACYTDTPDADGVSFAGRLLARGAAAVIGTETSVTDRYATSLFARVYTQLAETDHPDVVRAVAEARRIVHRELASATDRLDQAISGLDEWSVVSIVAARPAVPAYDPGRAAQSLSAAQATVAGLLTRPVGEFVGRRFEQRTLPALLASDSAWPGVLLHGIGGVGKTTLAAELVHHATRHEPGRLVAVATGSTSVDGLLSAVAAVLRQHLIVTGQTSGMTWAAVEVANRLDVGWADRYALLRQHVLGQLGVLVVLDNFEDNLARTEGGTSGWRVADQSLAGLLAAWIDAPGRSRLLVTSRHPFPLPAGAGLYRQRLGPMTFAETLKLIWALPHLDQLDDDQVERVWRMVGGHPRTLEYLDALLAGGVGRFPDITDRLAKAVRAKLGEETAQRWLHTGRDLDVALAEVVTLAADDILLGEHLTRLATVDGAVRLLVGASVYREPVDEAALLFQIGTPDDTASNAEERRDAAEQIGQILQRHGLTPDELAQALDRATSPLPESDRDQLAAQLRRYSEPPTPPRSTSADLDPVLRVLSESSLLSTDEETGLVFVHRWTAAELERHVQDTGQTGVLQAAHRSAAAYWRWRVQEWPQDREADVKDLIEARYHLLEAGDVEEAGTVTEDICSQLHQWGAWDHETALIHDTLTHQSLDSPRQPAWIYRLGILAHARGDYPEAERRYQQSLTINEQLSNQAGMATSYHQLGNLAYLQGDYPEAERRYQQSLTIDEQLSNQAGMASSYHQLGMLAQDRGDYPEAERRYQQALTINEQLGNQAGIATTISQLGILRTALQRPREAVPLHVTALAIRLGIGVPQAHIDLRALRTLRGQLGEGVFLAEAGRSLDEESVANLLRLLDSLGDE